jgi:hypothetical protein
MILSLLYSWIMSLSIFWPPTFFRFVIAVIQAIAHVYSTLVTKFWWIIPIFFSLLMLSPAKPTSLLYAWLFVLYFVYICIWVFLSLFVTRHSTSTKTSNILVRGIKSLFYFILMGAVLFLISYYSFTFQNTKKILFLPFLLPLAVSWFFFACLFYIDSSKESAKSTWRGLKMAIYNYPFCLLATHICYGFAYILYKIYIILPAQLSIFISWKLIKVFMMVFFSFIFLTIVFVPIIACIFACFYEKRVTDQRSLYFAK